MAFSAKMLAVLQKIEAADAKHFAGLRESAKRDAKVREQRKRAETTKRKPPEPVRVSSPTKTRMPKRKSGNSPTS